MNYDEELKELAAQYNDGRENDPIWRQTMIMCIRSRRKAKEERESKSGHQSELYYGYEYSKK